MTDEIIFSEYLFKQTINFGPLILLLSEPSSVEEVFIKSLCSNVKSKEDYFFIESFTDLRYTILDLQSNSSICKYFNIKNELVLIKNQLLTVTRTNEEAKIKYSIQEINSKKNSERKYEIVFKLKNLENNVLIWVKILHFDEKLKFKSPFNSNAKKAVFEAFENKSKSMRFKGNSNFYINVIIPAPKQEVFEIIVNLDSHEETKDIFELSMEDGSKLIKEKNTKLYSNWKDQNQSYIYDIVDFNQSNELLQDSYYEAKIIETNPAVPFFSYRNIVKSITANLSLFVVIISFDDSTSRVQMNAMKKSTEGYLKMIKKKAIEKAIPK